MAKRGGSASGSKDTQRLGQEIDIDLLHSNWEKYSGIDDEMSKAEFEKFTMSVNLSRRTSEKLWRLLDSDKSGLVSRSELAEGFFQLQQYNVWIRYCPTCEYTSECPFCHECNQTCQECDDESFCSVHWAQHPGRAETCQADTGAQSHQMLRNKFGTAAYFRAALVIRPLEWAYQADNGLGVQQKAWLRQVLRNLKGVEETEEAEEAAREAAAAKSSWGEEGEDELAFSEPPDK